MPSTQIVCGNQTVPVTLDDYTQVVKQEVTVPIAVEPDLAGGVQKALQQPLDRPALPDQVKPGARVTIAFDDPTVPCYAPVWEHALAEIVKQLNLGGVRDEDMTLVCANALHRQFTYDELARTIGTALARRFKARLRCHDAEDADNIVDLGTTARGFPVQLNRAAVDTDLCIYLNASCWRAFNGGWKSICVGLSTYASIRTHHTPDIMSMSSEKNRMHEMLNEMGALCEEKLGAEHFFKVETVLANPIALGKMWAGSIQATRAKVLDLHAARGTARRHLVAEKVDIVCYGVPSWSPYAAFAKMNPLLSLVSTGLGYLGGVIEALGKPGCSVVLATPCPDQWDEIHHPSYREVWNDILGTTRDPFQIREQYEETFAKRADYLAKYRTAFGFHPTHGIMATYPLKRLKHAARVYVAHAERAALVEHLGFIATSTVDDAIAKARAIHGANATVALVKYPMAFNRQ